MNRTTIVMSFAFVGLVATLPGQTSEPPAGTVPQADPIEAIVATMRGAEQQAKSLRLQLTTMGRLPDGLELRTHGVLAVLRGAQPKVHSVVEFSFGDGLSGRMESAQTERGIVSYEDNPLGEVYLHFPPEVVKDIEWAGEVLKQADLPGMADPRAQAPLGSAMLTDLRRHFDLGIDARGKREGEVGQWLVGKRRAGLEDQDPELPLADRVELFVRQADHALVECIHWQADKVLQQIVVTKLEVDLELPETTFQVDGHGQRLREVQQYQPMWEQIQQALNQAEGKSAPGVVRPSRR